VSALDQLGKELLSKLNIIIEQQNVFAACVECGVNALVIARRNAQVVRISDNGEAVALGAALSNRVVVRGIVDGPDMEILILLERERVEKARQYRRTIEEDGYDSDPTWDKANWRNRNLLL